ncbi:MAG: hypothetical protein JNM27_21235 [Leptospirales bacterium]|nr:hypothetical protein [Leptospirales bacterium]
MLEKMNPRERLMVLGLAGLLGLVALLFLAMKIQEQRESIRDSVNQAAADVQRIKRLRDDIIAMPSSAPLPDENEFLTKTQALLDRLKFTPQNIRSHKDNPSRDQEQIVVELTFAGVALKDAIAFLHAVEFGREVPARIGNFEFRKPLPNREIYDMRIQLVITRQKVAR